MQCLIPAAATATATVTITATVTATATATATVTVTVTYQVVGGWGALSWKIHGVFPKGVRDAVMSGNGYSLAYAGMMWWSVPKAMETIGYDWQSMGSAIGDTIFEHRIALEAIHIAYDILTELPFAAVPSSRQHRLHGLRQPIIKRILPVPGPGP